MASDPFKLRHPFFRPRSRRVLTIAAVLGWALFELAGGNTVWFVLFSALGAYLWVEFFLRFDPENFKDNETD